MIELAKKENCTGCYTCINICPKKAISFIPDKEGFNYPSINNEKCIECRMCIKACPQLLFNKKNTNKQPQCFAVYSKNHQKNGSSGGAFSAIADYVIEHQGVVFGAAFDENLILKHKAVSRKEEMQPLRGSKYLQSDLNDVFKQIKLLLQQDKIVLFCGTPCQVDGLNYYLQGKNNNNLIRIDFICHGVPSQKAFSEWMNQVSKKKGEINNFHFRKLNGWSILPRIELKNGKLESLRYDLEVYMNAFYNGYLFRPSCYNCKYANLHRPSDITLADFWGIGKYETPFKEKQKNGISLVLTNSEKGKTILENITSKIYCEERPINEALHEQHNLKSPSSKPKERDTAALDFVSGMSLMKFGQLYALLPKNKLKYWSSVYTKEFLLKIGLFDLLKELFLKLKNNL